MSDRWRRHRVSLSWGRMSVEVAGEGPPLLLLHGLGGSGRYWAGLAPVLARSRTLIAPDLAGFGRSDKPSASYSRDFHVDSLEGLLVGLGVEGTIGVAGHSMGGVLGALYTAAGSRPVDALAIVASPFPRTRTHPYHAPRGWRRGVYRGAQAILPLASPLVRSLVRSGTFPRAVIADYLRHTVDSYNRTSDALIWDPSAVDALAPLREDGRDVLLLFSEQDGTVSPQSLQRWSALLPRAEVVLAPGGHQLLLRGGFGVLAAWFTRPAETRVA